MSADEWAAIVLAGGHGARLGGADKAALQLAGRPLLAYALAACAGAAEVVVVGDSPPTPLPGDDQVRYVREQPAYAGPGAALLTGLEVLHRAPAYALVLAVDMPFVTEQTVRRLLAASAGHDGAALVDGDGRRQLAVVVRPEKVRAQVPDSAAREGISFWRTLAGLDLVDVSAQRHEARDLDSWPDVERAHQIAASHRDPA